MEFNKKTTAMHERRTLFEGTAEQAVDCDITLPDYFPDVVRVLKCTLTPRLTVVQGGADRITADGSGLLRVLYLSEGNTVRCFEQNIPFSKSAETTLPQNACVHASASTEYVNCRVVSPRKMDVHGSISVSFKAYCKEPGEIICDCDGAGVQTRKKKLTVSSLAGCAEKLFTLNETLEIGNAKPSIAQLVRSEATAQLESVKLVSGKALLKGELTLHTLYIPDGDDSGLQTMEHSMPISQIMEIEGAEEDCTADVALTVSALEIAAKTDASGALRLLDTTVTVCASVELYQDFDTNVILDAYSTQYEMQVQQNPVELRRICDRFTDTYLCRGTLDLAGSNLAEVADVRCTGVQYTASTAENEIRVSGEVAVAVLYRDREGEWGVAQRSFEFSYSRATANTGGTLVCTPHITATGINFLMNAEDKLDVRVELDIHALVFTRVTEQIVTDLRLNEENRKTKKTAALTIYFSQAGESVWDIARRYNTTVEAIMTENGLEGDVVSEKCKLLIPRV